MPASLPASAPHAIFEAPLRWWVDIVDGTGRLPTRLELRPEALSPTCIPHLLLVEVVDGGVDLRQRLVGQHLRDLSRRDHSRQLFSEMIPSRTVLDYLLELYAHVVTVRRPVWTVNRVCYRAGVSRLLVSRLLLPVACPSGSVAFVFGAQLVEYPADAARGARDLWFQAPSVEEVERSVL